MTQLPYMTLWRMIIQSIGWPCRCDYTMCLRWLTPCFDLWIHNFHNHRYSINFKYVVFGICKVQTWVCSRLTWKLLKCEDSWVFLSKMGLRVPNLQSNCEAEITLSRAARETSVLLGKSPHTCSFWKHMWPKGESTDVGGWASPLWSCSQGL